MTDEKHATENKPVFNQINGDAHADKNKYEIVFPAISI